MNFPDLRKRFILKGDSGLSLMEVIVAIAIMTIVATAAASLSINGVKTVANEERSQVAVTVANGYMEKVSGWSTVVNAAGLSAVYTGRSQGDVQYWFGQMSSRPGVAQTNAVWDTTVPVAQSATCTASTGALKICDVVSENGTNYQVVTLIGSCYQQTTGASGSCLAAKGASPDAMIRVTVIVSWTAGAQCAASGCYYQTSTLLDPSSDLEWVQH